MSTIHTPAMLNYLSRSMSSLNQNKLNGMLAEIDFREYLDTIGFGSRVCQGGWIARRVRDNKFASDHVALFPETIYPNESYPEARNVPQPDHGLHTVAAKFHEIGVHAFYCAAEVHQKDDPASVRWRSMQI